MLDWFRRLFRPQVRAADDGYPPEERVPFEDPGISARILAGQRVFLVKRSQSGLHFDPDEWIKKTYSPRFSQDATSIEVEDRSGAVVAAVGWTVYPGANEAVTIGTFVAEKLRRRGLAQALWRAMITNCGKPAVSGCAATDEGFTLLRSMKEQFPGVVSFDGDFGSEFTDLRKKKGTTDGDNRIAAR